MYNTVLFLILGLLIGSFLNVCIFRIPREESISFPPSHCGSCGTRIKPYDLIPVISYMLLGGKCRNCKAALSIQYPLIELATGLLFAALYIEFGLTLECIKFMVFFCLLIVIGVIDLKTTDVYTKTTVTGIAIGIIFIILGYFFGGSQEIWPYVFGGLLGGGTISVIILLTHGMGWGDAEICLMCGLFLGFRATLVLLFLAFVIGGITGLLLILTKKKTRKDYIPFGPFLSLGAMMSTLFGQKLIDLYVSLLIR